MIYGIGTDIVEKKRIAQAVKKNERFIQKICTEQEKELLDKRRNREDFLAMNFAGKEAVAKAFGTGFAGGLLPRDIEILRNEKGAPFVILYGKAKEMAEEKGIFRIHISLSDTREEYAVAYVVAEAEQNGKEGRECNI